ncbi:MAG: hypothetical protein KQ78_01772 [Candidatus Izimaplasma bacterium HR2]|nr:MAG: hypothetical protein KQ78_01772 [Candidatus Izimaplasma bacterium HR2]
MFINKEKRKFLQRIKKIRNEIKLNNEKIEILESINRNHHVNLFVEKLELKNHKLEMSLLFLKTQYDVRKKLNEWD